LKDAGGFDKGLEVRNLWNRYREDQRHNPVQWDEDDPNEMPLLLSMTGNRKMSRPTLLKALIPDVALQAAGKDAGDKLESVAKGLPGTWR